MKYKLRQLFCSHFYIVRKHSKPFYVSSGDEYHDRQSDHYYLHCPKCDHTIDVIMHWSTKEETK